MMEIGRVWEALDNVFCYGAIALQAVARQVQFGMLVNFASPWEK